MKIATVLPFPSKTDESKQICDENCCFYNNIYIWRIYQSINSVTNSSTLKALGGVKLAPEILTPEVLKIPAKSFSIFVKPNNELS